ncbi:uncharacterized protein [Choristoneura fumiferana]|uniref:uncharacterized protein n=1 Tax=Choristoneura fumiferana TaxID=7141 RepID=UPI003D1545E6
MADTTNIITFNCKNIKRSVDCVRNLCLTAGIIALQETWLMEHDISFLSTINDEFAFTGKSAIDSSVQLLRGRPHGGVALLWKKALFPCVSVIQCKSVRLVAIKLILNDRPVIVMSVYMPSDSAVNLSEFTECLGEIYSIVESNDVESVFVLGDFNAHPGESFYLELLNFCNEQTLTCVDMDLLPSDTYTYVSDAHGCRRWLDHCVVTSAARVTVVSAAVLYNVYWSDHYPLLLKCNFNLVKAKVMRSNKFSCNKVMWAGLRMFTFHQNLLNVLIEFVITLSINKG